MRIIRDHNAEGDVSMPSTRQQNSDNSHQAGEALLDLVRLLARAAAREAATSQSYGNDQDQQKPCCGRNRDGE
jgi:hypothetical protein